MRPVQAGLLDKRISVDEPVTSQSSSGAPIVSWVSRTTVWGSIEPIRGREATQAGDTFLAQMDTRIKLRISPVIAGMTSKWRLRHSGIIYDVVSVVDVEMKGRLFELLCKSGVNKG